MLFWEVNRRDSLAGIVQATFGPFASHQQWMAMTDQIYKLNAPLLRDPHQIYPGQLLTLGSTKSVCSQPMVASDLISLCQEWNKTIRMDREVIQSSGEFLGWFLESGTDPVTLAGALTSSGAYQLVKQLADFTAKGLKPPPVLVYELERIVFVAIQNAIVHVKNDATAILKTQYRFFRQKAFILEVDAQGMYSYFRKLKLIKQALSLFRSLPYVLIAIDALRGTLQYIQESDPRRKQLIGLQNGLGLSGGALGGYFGSYVAIAGCNFMFAGPSLGTSLAWCNVMGIGGSYVGSVAGTASGKFLGTLAHGND